MKKGPQKSSKLLKVTRKPFIKQIVFYVKHLELIENGDNFRWYQKKTHFEVVELSCKTKIYGQQFLMPQSHIKGIQLKCSCSSSTSRSSSQGPSAIKTE
jgi:hypothetical protein